MIPSEETWEAAYHRVWQDYQRERVARERLEAKVRRLEAQVEHLQQRSEVK